jgi:hypothetical protein
MASLRDLLLLSWSGCLFLVIYLQGVPHLCLEADRHLFDALYLKKIDKNLVLFSSEKYPLLITQTYSLPYPSDHAQAAR